MKTRKEIKAAKVAIYEKMEKMQDELTTLAKEELMVCDDESWYTEAPEERPSRKGSKKMITELIGRVHWNEDFIDEDNGQVVNIERSRVVRVDDKWNLYG